MKAKKFFYHAQNKTRLIIYKLNKKFKLICVINDGWCEYIS